MLVKLIFWWTKCDTEKNDTDSYELVSDMLCYTLA